MRARFWKGIFSDEPKCGAEMKVGIQVFRDLRCQLPAGHAGRHQSNALTSWQRKPTDPNPGAKEDV
jgi:hypothetical protein